MESAKTKIDGPIVREVFGLGLVVLAIGLTIVGFYMTFKESHRLALRQDLVYAMLESDNYPLAILNENGSVIQWNKGMEKLTGVDVETAKKFGLSIVCPPEYSDRHNKGFVKSMEHFQTGKLLIVNCEIHNSKTNRIIPVRIAVREVVAGGNKFAVARIDRISQITELGKRADEKLIQADRSED